MTTLWLIIQREFVSNVLTSRFMIGFIVCLMSTAAAVFVQVADYEKRLAAYHVALQEHQEEVQTWDLYSQINPKAHRKPNPFSIFNVGTEKSGADMVSIELATPIWEKEAQKQGSDNPFLSIFLSVDVIFVFKIVLSALAILFAYNTISGETGGWHTKIGVIQSDSEGRSCAWEIPRRHAVSISDCGDEFHGMESLSPTLLPPPILIAAICYASLWYSLFRCCMCQSAIF